MSVSTEITRIQTARNTLRTKAVDLGVGLATDNLTQLATKYDAIVNQGTVNANVKEGESFTIPKGYHNGSGVVNGVAGGGNYTLEAKTVTPTKSEINVTSSAGYYGLSGVTVNPIPDAYQDVSDVTATADKVLTGSTFVTSAGVVTAGTMANKGAVTASLNTTTTSYTIPSGYHSGAGKVSITTESKTVTPTTSSQTVSPASGKVLSSVTVNAIPSKYGDAIDATITAGDVLTGKIGIGYDASTSSAVSVTGTMANNGAVSKSLNCGGSYTIPAGYHNGSGKVTANSLASQTGVETGKTAVTAATMLTGYQGWVSGARVTGTMANNGAVSGSITGLGSVTGDTSFSIPAGYTTGGTVSITSDIETALSAI